MNKKYYFVVWICICIIKSCYIFIYYYMFESNYNWKEFICVFIFMEFFRI